MFPLRQAARQVIRAAPRRPLSATAAPLVAVADADGVAVVTLQRAPVNSLNLDLLQAVGKALDDVAKNKPRGMILTSALPTVFTAGLDITEMFKPDPKRIELFWTTLQDTWIKLFGFEFATAAAINGHSPAGGCLLAMSCEYRVMVVGKYTIGLNESRLGIVATPWFMDTMCHTIAKRNAEIALTTGKLFTTDEALKVGLIDEVATDKTDAIEKCKRFISRFDRIPPAARAATKLQFRRDVLMRLQSSRQQDRAEFIQLVNDPRVQKDLKMYIQSLKQKATKQATE